GRPAQRRAGASAAASAAVGACTVAPNAEYPTVVVIIRSVGRLHDARRAESGLPWKNLPRDTRSGDPPRMSSKPLQRLDRVVIRFAGDSGDGMQLTGDRFTSETAALGNDLSTLPNFPAEIRAPAGTLPGVSSFQLHFADHDVLTPGDHPDVLVAMNPAALKANLGDVPRGATIIVNQDEFTKRNLTRVGYRTSPLEDGSLESYHVHSLPLTSMTVEALAGFELTRKEKRSEEHTSELQSRENLVCRLLLEKKKNNSQQYKISQKTR